MIQKEDVKALPTRSLMRVVPWKEAITLRGWQQVSLKATRPSQRIKEHTDFKGHSHQS